jgi:hypothetical protein
MSQVQILSPRPIIYGLGGLTAIAGANGLTGGLLCEQRVGRSNASDPTAFKKGGQSRGEFLYNYGLSTRVAEPSTAWQRYDRRYK